MPDFSGRLFGPGLAGVGEAVQARWRGGRLSVTTPRGDDLLAADPQVTASGFNAALLQVGWHSADGDYALFIETPEARAAFASGAPAAAAAAAKRAGARQASVERRFRLGWAALALIFALPVIAVVVFVVEADRIAAWAVGRVPIEYEAKLGELVLAQTRAQMKLGETGAAADAVRTIGEKLTTGTRHRYRWFVAERGDVNAFAAPGGVVVVYAGLLHSAARPEEAAGVIAHEVAHAELRHGLQGMAKGLGLRALLALVVGDWSGGLLGDAATRLTELKFSRDAEREADHDGLARLRAAGIDATGMLAFFERLARQEQGKLTPPGLLSTHPASAERLAELRQALAAGGAQRATPLAIDWDAVRAAVAHVAPAPPVARKNE